MASRMPTTTKKTTVRATKSEPLARRLATAGHGLTLKGGAVPALRFALEETANAADSRASR
jgi:hypothetical protein